MKMKYLLLGLALFAGSQLLAAEDDISYPIAELGSCSDKEACFTY